MRRVILALIAALAAPMVALGRPPPAASYDAVVAVLEDVCLPAAKGADAGKLAAADGYRIEAGVWTLRSDDFSLSFTPPGPGDPCVVDVVHPYDEIAPAREIVMTLNDWANAHRGWSLDRNDRYLQGEAEITTRSWRGPAGAVLAFVTRRRADGTPLQPDSDTSQLTYRPGSGR